MATEPQSGEQAASVTVEGVSPEISGGVKVHGKVLADLPEDLYIPPDALEVYLDEFEGPLDLLLYLIRRNNMDILSLNVSEITTQYLAYIEVMQVLKISLAAEYLLMAAMLAEIKSRSLLPRPTQDDEEEDAAADLIRRLQEYERFRTAAEGLDELPRCEREIFPARAEPPVLERVVRHPDVELAEVILAFRTVLHRRELKQSHRISEEPLSTRERMTEVLGRLRGRGFLGFETLFSFNEGRLGVVVTLLAILELAKEGLIEMIQNAPMEPIHVRLRSSP